MASIGMLTCGLEFDVVVICRELQSPSLQTYSCDWRYAGLRPQYGGEWLVISY